MSRTCFLISVTLQFQKSSATEETDKCWLFCNHDGYYNAIEHTEEHENVIAFYYMDEALRVALLFSITD